MTNLIRSAAQNRETVLEFIQQHGSVTQPEIIAQFGFTESATTHYVRHLHRDDEIHPLPKRGPHQAVIWSYGADVHRRVTVLPSSEPNPYLGTRDWLQAAFFGNDRVAA